MCGITSVEGAFAGADVVFVGKVIKITSVKEASVGLLMKESGTLELLKTPRWEKSVYKARSVTLEVVEAFKGMTTKTVDVLTSLYDGGATCGVNFRLGESYLVYADKRQPSLSDAEAKLPKESWTQEIRLKAEADKFNKKLPSLSTSICSRTEHLRWVKDEVDKVRLIAKDGLPNIEREQDKKPVRVIPQAMSNNDMQRTRATAPLSWTLRWRSPLMPGVRHSPLAWEACGELSDARSRKVVMGV
jgi:hypothetical protein